jgi:hypothetical protein
MDSTGRSQFVSRGFHALVVLMAALATGTVVFVLVSTGGLFGLIADSVVAPVNLGLPWLILAGAALAIWKKLSYLITLPVLAVSGGLLAYLAWDVAPAATETPMPRLAAEDSKAVVTYRWLLKSGPGSRSAEIPAGSLDLALFPTERSEWAAFVTKNRRAFEEAWAADTLVREWTDLMAAHPPDGLFPVGGADAPMLNFTALRHSTKIRWARAQLLLLDSKGDEAARLLLSLLRVGYNLQQGCASLVHQMIASVIVKGTYDRLELAAESSALSPATRAEVVAALRLAPPVPGNFGRAFLGEEILARATIAQTGEGYAFVIKSVGSAENTRFSANRVLGRLLFNPARTQRDYLAFLHTCCRLAQKRQLAAAWQAYKDFEAGLETKRLKNPVGQLLTTMVTPAFLKVADAFWKAEDQRIALLQRLEASHR